MSLKVCTGCGITNKSEYFRCVACDQRLDRPLSLGNKDDVFEYFSRGGFTEIAEELKIGNVPWDGADVEYTRVLERSIFFSLEESFSTLDVLFYSESPTFNCPYLGIRWPKSTVLDAVRMGFRFPDGTHRFTNIERRKSDDKGSAYRFDHSLGREGIQFEINLIAVYGKSAGPNKTFESSTIVLQAENPSDRHSSYVLKRPTTGIKVS